MNNLYKLVVISLFALFLFVNCSTGSGSRREEYIQQQETLREIKYGRLLAAKILTKYPLYKNKKINDYVNKVGKSVALFAGRSDIDYFFSVLDTDSINAYAAPGGYVFISKGALKEMRNEDELAGVLAHEIGHINNKHIMKELPPPRETGGFVDFLASILVAQGAVVSSTLSEAVNKAADLLFTKGYKINDEYEADRSAILYADETGYNPSGLIDFLNRIWEVKKKNKKTVVYNTHPPFEDRLARLRGVIKAGNIKTDKPKITDRFIAATAYLK